MTKTFDCLYIALQLQVVKAIWAYVKEHNLQDPKNKRKIVCDEKLGKVLPARTDMFKMNKELSKHVFTQGKAAVLHTTLQSFCGLPFPEGTERIVPAMPRHYAHCWCFDPRGSKTCFGKFVVNLVPVQLTAKVFLHLVTYRTHIILSFTVTGTLHRKNRTAQVPLPTSHMSHCSSTP